MIGYEGITGLRPDLSLVHNSRLKSLVTNLFTPWREHNVETSVMHNLCFLIVTRFLRSFLEVSPIKKTRPN